MTERKDSVDGTNNTEKELESDGDTKLSELSAKVSDELDKKGSGGPWVWCVRLSYLLLFIKISKIILIYTKVK